MKLISASTMRELDRRTIETFGIPGCELMQVAGEGLADAIRRLAASHHLVDAPVLFVAGCGNNGGDAFVAAQALYEDEWPVEVWLAGSESKLKGDALLHFKRMKKADVPILVLANAADWQEVAERGNDAEIIVDGLLGTGASGEPHGVVADAIRFVDSCADRALVVAIDIPSAMAVRADLTVTMGLPKIDLVQPENVDWVGNVEVVDIGIPAEYIEAAEGDKQAELICPSDLAQLFPRRPRDSHKGDYGHVLCLGGSKGYSGAITMAARAAARSGAGLVTACVSEEIYPIVAPAIPEVMVHTHIPKHDWSAILVGPGLGFFDAARELVLKLLRESRVPLVLDADAVTLLEGHTEAIAAAQCPVILTPHPGEFARLLGLKTDEVQEDRFGLAKMAAENLKATIVLKGAGTIVATPGLPLGINMTGNPGMATGGSGDLLAGLLVGLAAQLADPFQAACAAVWLHGRAADLAAAEKSQATFVPPDLLEKLPEAFREISCR